MFNRFVTRLVLLTAAAGLMLSDTMLGQERAKIALSFLPPPLETATYSLGVYDARTHKIVRHLHEYAPASVFTAGLNGLITSWDGKGDDGKPVPPGRYAARGYAMGEMKVEGKAILGNDWASENENLRLTSVKAIAILPEDGGLAVLATNASGHFQLACFKGEDGTLRWSKELAVEKSAMDTTMPFTSASLVVTDTILIVSRDKEWRAYKLLDGSSVKADAPYPPDPPSDWKIEEGVLSQYSAQGERARSLAPKDGEPLPVMVSASRKADRLYLLEESKSTQRVRGLSWKENTKEGDKAISTWTTFFENSISPGFVPLGPEKTELGTQVEIALVENPLSPGKAERLKLSATYDAKGSYLATADGLRLRQISERPNLRAVKLGKNKAANALDFYQCDGAAWDQFSVEGAREIIGFDAGEIDLTATGEKTPPKTTEPDL